MCSQVAINEYLSQFEEGSVELGYYTAILGVLCSLSLPQSEAYGFACIAVFHNSVITLRNGMVIGKTDDVMGSIEDIAGAISIVFMSVQPNERWWKAGYPHKVFDIAVKKAALHILSSIQQLDMVDHIEILNFRSWII